jgi:hypothetical protein
MHFFDTGFLRPTRKPSTRESASATPELAFTIAYEVHWIIYPCAISQAASPLHHSLLIPRIQNLDRLRIQIRNLEIRIMRLLINDLLLVLLLVDPQRERALLGLALLALRPRALLRVVVHDGREVVGFAVCGSHGGILDHVVPGLEAVLFSDVPFCAEVRVGVAVELCFGECLVVTFELVAVEGYVVVAWGVLLGGRGWWVRRRWDVRSGRWCSCKRPKVWPSSCAGSVSGILCREKK